MSGNFTRLALALLAAAPLVAGAQSFRCVGKDGKKYYGSTIPPECIGQPVEQLNSAGSVIRRIDPEGDEKARAAKEAEAERKRQEDAANREESRRNRALLATYSSEKDVEDGRRRALENDQRLANELEGKIAALRQKRATEKDPKALDADLQAQEGLLATKKKEIAAINAKYDDDKKRYLELTGRK